MVVLKPPLSEKVAHVNFVLLLGSAIVKEGRQVSINSALALARRPSTCLTGHASWWHLLGRLRLLCASVEPHIGACSAMHTVKALVLPSQSCGVDLDVWGVRPSLYEKAEALLRSCLECLLNVQSPHQMRLF